MLNCWIHLPPGLNSLYSLKDIEDMTSVSAVVAIRPWLLTPLTLVLCSSQVFSSWANINITDCLYSLTSASALQKCPESSVYGCTNRQTGHQSWLCITLPNSRHTISPEANCGQLKQTADTIKVHSFTSRPSRRNNWAKTADGKEIPVASCIRPICYVVSLTLARAAEQIKNLKREKNAKLFL